MMKTYHITYVHHDCVQPIHASSLLRLISILAFFLPQSKVFLFRRKERLQIEVLGEGDKIVQLLETTREGHRVGIILGNLLEALEVDD